MLWWSFNWEVTDRRSWPSNWGRITLLAETERDAFDHAFHAVMLSAKAAMVTRLDLVDWQEEP